MQKPPHSNIVVQLEPEQPRWVMGYIALDGKWRECASMPATPSEEEPARRADLDKVGRWVARVLGVDQVGLRRVVDTQRATWWVAT
ncbi:hypothetical protein [Saccharopolyspora pogona]|uniref:hypothetical protein n=1 Tax=Saccharopolyspora pogona TaxID=333966 RepID=UPI001688AB51|nr:hypothetical protein [Saccharopolyspora pogona]